MRSPIAVRPEVCATCNPDPDSWLLPLVQPYLDDAGYPRRELSGCLVYFAIHADSDELVVERTRAACRRRAKTTDAAVWSFAFFPATVADNAYMLALDPDYAEKYAAKVGTTRVRRERLVGGNWYVRELEGGPLREDKWDICGPSDVPKLVARVRCWDRAATRPSAANTDPDYSGGVLCGWDANGRFFAGLGDRGVVALRDEPGPVSKRMRLTALDDGPTVVQRIPIDPGGAGKESQEWTIERMRGPGIGRLDWMPQPSGSGKEVRAQPLAEALELGRCSFVRGPWADQAYQDPRKKTTMWRLLWSHLDPFPGGDHDDFADCVAGAFNARRLAGSYRGLGREGWARGQASVIPLTRGT
jgi:phage terminase large subunit-like protein